jgi:alpha-L-arabinofuranosidase
MILLPFILLLHVVSAVDFQLAIDSTSQWRNISQYLYSQFIEDINHAVTGGLHGQLASDPQCQSSSFYDATSDSRRRSLTNVAFPGFFIRYFSDTDVVMTVEGGETATWIVQPALNGNPNAVSLILTTDSQSYLTESGGNVITSTSPSSASASWILQGQKTGSGPFDYANFTLESVSIPGKYLASSPYPQGGATWIGTHYQCILQTDNSSLNALFNFSPARSPSQESWEIVGPQVNVSIDTTPPFVNGNSSSHLLVNVSSQNTPRVNGVCNRGFFGFSSDVGEVFSLEFYSRVPSSSQITGLSISIESLNGSIILSSVDIALPPSTNWLKSSLQLQSSLQNDRNRICFYPNNQGEVFLDIIIFSSLNNSVNQKPNGFRDDITQVLQEMKPAAFRFPGGSYILGQDNSSWYQFAKTVGPLETRPGHVDLWGYNSTDYAGLYEYLDLIVNVLESSPIWVINCGMGNNYDYSPGDPLLQPFIDNALGSIEFIVGDAKTTYWGSIRSAMGRTDPFPLKFVAIGNENCQTNDYTKCTSYQRNYIFFYDLLKSKYPDIMFIANSDLTDNGKNPANISIDLWDYHLYPTTDYFFENQYQWDSYDRITGHPIFNSEYAAKTNAFTGNLIGAISEAVWMIGNERNSDIVLLSSYAPLFCHEFDQTWLPDAIMFNSNAVYGKPSYWNQVLFSQNTPAGSVLLGYNATALQPGVTTSPAPFTSGLPLYNNVLNITVSALITPSGLISVKIVNYANVVRTMTVSVNASNLSPFCSLETISGNPLDTNTIDEPYNVVPILSSDIPCTSTDVITLQAYSINVLSFSP